VLDLAVGIIIGAAFTAIVNSLVGDLIMPFISLATGGVDFTNLFVVLRAPAADLSTLEAARRQGQWCLPTARSFRRSSTSDHRVRDFLIVRQANKLRGAPAA
jgi:hypothetical protein